MTILSTKSIYVSFCVALLCFAAVSRSTTGTKFDNPVVEKRFKSWLEQHDKHYKDKDEWMLRFGIYQANLDFIEFFNAQNLSYKLGDNEFADLTNNEFQDLYVGRLDLSHTKFRSTNSTMAMSSSTHEAPPPEVDWRNKGAVNEVKNQGQCGSCWAFSTCSSIESINQINTGKLVSLSEQELVDCDTLGQNKGCRGGLMEEAFKYIINNGGISTEQDYPYKGTQGSCHSPDKKTVKISGHMAVKPKSEKDLLAAVAQQPVAAALDSGGSPFQLYSTGIFKGGCGTRLNHAVNLVGYGEENGAKFWIVRNSWGPNWGEKGYIRLLRDAPNPEGTCGIAMMASYPLQ